MSFESMLFWVAVIVYAFATLAVTFGLTFKVRRLTTTAAWLTFGGFVAHTASIIVRWVDSGRLPYVQDYENMLAGTWAIIGTLLLVMAIWKRLQLVAIGVLPFALLTMGYAVTLPPEPGPVTPAYQSAWLAVHVLFAWATYAAYTAAAGISIVRLLQIRRHRASGGPVIERLPDGDSIDAVAFRLVAFGFLVNAVMIASGSIWAYELWGSYWRWDPVETWSLLTWLAFGFYMHARLTLGWDGKRLAWVAILALFGVMMSFWGVQILPSSYHLFQDLGGSLTNNRF